MPTTTVTKFYRVVGSRKIGDGKVRHFLEEVGDFTGVPLANNEARVEEQYDTPAAQRQADDTIVKVVTTHTVNFTVNPTS